ncbi:MAG: hypothetical protein JXK94_08050 [Deltaproteobacteria bacterium]|nr:hypothetical protein [Deltaproteobacteria bacterium]
MTFPANTQPFAMTRNACTTCSSLGAVMAFAGVENSICLLHRSQGCSTFIRRYLIGHFREPMDIASSNFHDSSALFGGRSNLFVALDNVINQYRPSTIGIVPTCLAETIGEDLKQLLHEYRKERDQNSLPALVAVSTPSYQGTHADGFSSTVRAMIECLAEDGAVGDSLVLLPGMVSPADLCYLKEVLSDFGIAGTVLPASRYLFQGAHPPVFKRVADKNRKYSLRPVFKRSLHENAGLPHSRLQQFPFQRRAPGGIR